MFYGTGSYGFYGYAFADLGDKFDFVHTSVQSLPVYLIHHPLLFQSAEDGYQLVTVTKLGKRGMLTRFSPASVAESANAPLVKGTLTYPSRSRAFNSSQWGLPHDDIEKGGSPFRGLMRQATKQAVPQTSIGVLGESPHFLSLPYPLPGSCWADKVVDGGKVTADPMYSFVGVRKETRHITDRYRR